MVCNVNVGDHASKQSGRFVVGGVYQLRQRNEYYERSATYVVAKRSAKFVTLEQINSLTVRPEDRESLEEDGLPLRVNYPPRRLAVRFADDGTECLLLGHPKACGLTLLWSVNHTHTFPSGLIRSTVVLSLVATVAVP